MLTKNDEFVVSRNGVVAGAYALGQFEEMLRCGTVRRTDLIWRQEMTE